VSYVLTSLDDPTVTYANRLEAGVEGNLSDLGLVEEGEGIPLSGRMVSTSGNIYGTCIFAFSESITTDVPPSDMDYLSLFLPQETTGVFDAVSSSGNEESFPIPYLWFGFFDISNPENPCRISSDLDSSIQVTLDSYDSVGGRIIGTFVIDSLELFSEPVDGAYESNSLGDFRMEGSFNVKRFGDIHFYWISYDANGATSGICPSGVDQVTLGHASTASMDNSDPLLKTGYTFAGWNTESDGTGTTYQADGELIMPDHDVILYAMWEEDVSV
jgi:uncharacterized repeat protein (TIGR02543 family)